MLQDLRFAFRLIAKDRWYTTAAVVALALGIGVNATVFTLSSAALFRGLPFHDSHRLYMLSWQGKQGSRSNVSHAELQDWRAQVRTFTGLAAFSDSPMNISGDEAVPEQVRGSRLTANAFGVLGQPPLLGRDFTPDDERKGAETAVIIAYTMWNNRYGRSPAVVGKSIRLNGQPATIVGVMPDGMKFPRNAELWVPFIPTESQERRNSRPLNVFGRLRDDSSVEQARTEMNGIAQRLAAAYPDTNKELTAVRVETFTERFVGGNARVVFTVMLGAVAFVLLIACANVANLQLSRAADRAPEIAVRVALGATRLRVLRQLLLESVVLGVMGGAIGLLIAVVGVPIFDAAVQDPGKPYWIIFRVDYIVVAYVAAICVLTGIIFGLAPALHVARTNINDVLKEGGRGTAGRRRARWLTGTMVVVELALTIVLLAGAGLMIRSFMNLYTIDLGFKTDQLMVMRLNLPESKYATPEARRAFFERLEPRLRAIAGVDGLALTANVPPFGSWQRSFEIDGRPAPKNEEEQLSVSTVTITPGFFDALRMPVLRGRAFDAKDGAPGMENVIINERTAARYFPGEDPIGKRIKFIHREPPRDQPPPMWRTIVGIVPSIRHNSPQDPEPEAVLYLPYRQEGLGFASVLVRSQLPPGSVMAAVRREVQAIDPDQPVFTIQTLNGMLADSRWPYRVFGTLFVIFAVVALVLSAVGLYGVMAYSVTQRKQEIGVRMALGADGGQVSWLVLKRGLVQLAIGLTIGIGGAFALSRVMGRLLVQVTPTDPITFGAISIIVTVVAISACLLPARRAARVDPLVALRA